MDAYSYGKMFRDMLIGVAIIAAVAGALIVGAIWLLIHLFS